MLENTYSFFRLQKALRRVIVALFGASFSFLLGLFAFYQQNPSEVEVVIPAQRMVKKSGTVCSFSLPQEENIVLPIVLREGYKFRKIEKRPDSPAGCNYIALIDNDLNQSIVKSGAEVYLDYSPEKKKVVISRKQTPLSILPELASDDTLSLQVELLVPSMQKKTSVIVEKLPENVQLKLSDDFRTYIKKIEPAKAYPPDLLFKMYGGGTYAPLRDAYRLELDPEVFFVVPGDILVFDQERWRKKVEGENTCSYPLLQITKVSEQKVDLFLFDLEGRESFPLSIFVSRAKPKIGNLGETFVGARQRTPHSISCRLEKKNRLLQEGDWLLQGPKGWQVIRSAEELERFLRYQTPSDLIVLDKLEQGAFAGYYFDAKRSAAQKIFIPLVEEKSKKKNPQSATMETHDKKM